MDTIYNRLSNTQKGFILIGVGLVAILYILGYFGTILDTVFLIIAGGAIFYGALLAQLPQKIAILVERFTSKKKHSEIKPQENKSHQNKQH